VTIEPVADPAVAAEAAAARARAELEAARREQEAAKARDEQERQERRDKKKAKAAESGDGSGAGADAADDDDDDDGDDDDADSKLANPNSMNGGTTDKYLWGQTLAELEVRVPVPPGTRGKMLDVSIKARHLRVALKASGEVLIDGDLSEAIKTDESMWALEDGSILSLSLVKQNGMNWWSRVITDEPEINTRKIVPENSKLDDLDGDTRQYVC
jgi:hypothetical protein